MSKEFQQQIDDNYAQEGKACLECGHHNVCAFYLRDGILCKVCENWMPIFSKADYDFLFYSSNACGTEYHSDKHGVSDVKSVYDKLAEWLQ